MFSSFCNHKITQHFFFFRKRKPVLKEKQKCSFGKAFLFKKKFLVESRGGFFFYEIAKSLKFTAEHTENAKAPENPTND